MRSMAIDNSVTEKAFELKMSRMAFDSILTFLSRGEMSGDQLPWDAVGVYAGSEATISAAKSAAYAVFFWAWVVTPAPHTRAAVSMTASACSTTALVTSAKIAS